MKSDHFNGLTPAQAERLALLLEEMGEAQQIIGKILRHGIDSYHPDTGAVNRSLLEKEVGDVLAAVDLLVTEKDLDAGQVDGHRQAKHLKVRRYLHHQPDPLSGKVERRRISPRRPKEG